MSGRKHLIELIGRYEKKMSEHDENLNEEMSKRNEPLKDMLDGLNRPRGIRMPDRIQQACIMLGIEIPAYLILGTRVPCKEQDELTIDSVELAWKTVELAFVLELTGAQEEAAQKAAAYLKMNKDIVVRWIQENPNLGGSDPDQPSFVPRRPLPSAGSGAIALPLPEPETET